ncbi:MAG: CrcB family protein [Patulibacter sp.]
MRLPRHHILAAVVAGGMLGTALRAAAGLALPHQPGQWPWAILLVNLSGALLIGWWSAALPHTAGADPRLQPFLVTGLCGGLTSFSAIELDGSQLVPLTAAAYFAVSVAGGLLAVAAGRRAATVRRTRNAKAHR